MKKLDVRIGGNTVWVSHDKAEFQKIRECFHMIWLGKYNLLKLSIIMLHLIDPVVIHVTDKNDLPSFQIKLECCWKVLILHDNFPKCIVI